MIEAVDKMRLHTLTRKIFSLYEEDEKIKEGILHEVVKTFNVHDKLSSLKPLVRLPLRISLVEQEMKSQWFECVSSLSSS